MSDQWTKSVVQELRFNGDDEDQAVADAHNALLAEATKPLVDKISQARIELAKVLQGEQLDAALAKLI